MKNNPWHNAYNHACHIDVGTTHDIRKNIKALSDDFTNKKYHDVKDFNVMPGSTIFLEGRWGKINSSELKLEMVNLIESYEFKKINIICVNKKSVTLFWDYLNGS